AEIEVPHVERELPALSDIDDPPERGEASGPAVGGKAHDFVLAVVDAEAQEAGESAVEQAQGMGEVDFLEDLELTAAGAAVGGGGPLADAVHGQHGGLGETGVEEAARGVRMVVLEAQDGSLEPH